LTAADTRTTLTDSIAPGQWREVALSDDEYERIVELLGREPTPVELGMFGAMWSEHCGYKHSRPLLRQLPTKAPWVLQGPGENAGAVDIGDGLAVVFKVESHNHPSAVEPREGAATGVGGIVRDIFTMGARPVAILDSLRFGQLDKPRNRYLFTNVVGGIGGYGNCLGIPTVGGEVFFDSSFDGNPLVNAMCVGVTRHETLTRAAASGPGNVIMLVGADTGRDGLHGATFASVDNPEASHRGVIQVGNPFLEKLLMEACLELLEQGAVVAMQDLGAAGLTSSTVECASRGGVGAEIDVALVPRRETGMNAYEVMLSESQERMLLVVEPEQVGRVTEVVEHWSLHATAIGRVTDDGFVRVRDGDAVVVDVLAPLFTEACPTYVRHAEESPAVVAARETDPRGVPDLRPDDVLPALLDLLGSPNICSRRPVYRRYDQTIMTNTVVPPGLGDAAVLRIRGTNRAISAAIDCSSRYCYLDPALGAAMAVAEAARNVSCTGARPLALTNCLNFGNPERPAGAYQLREAVRGMAEAARALGIPVVSGNVSLYNESASQAVFPTPTVGVVGVIEDVSRHATMVWAEGDQVALISGAVPALGGSEYLARLHGMCAGRPAALDLGRESRVQQVVREAVADGLLRTAHDLSDGGLLVALAEMAIASRIGVTVDVNVAEASSTRLDERWFGEAPSRVLVAGAREALIETELRCHGTGLSFLSLGEVGGDRIAVRGLGEVPLQDAIERFEQGLVDRRTEANGA
jgi:phosphoribosylformylglycinamidine synthase